MSDWIYTTGPDALTHDIPCSHVGVGKACGKCLRLHLLDLAAKDSKIKEWKSRADGFLASCKEAENQLDFKDSQIGALEKRHTEVLEALEILQQDGHQWGQRPCTTCKMVSMGIGQSFGCMKCAEGGRR